MTKLITGQIQSNLFQLNETDGAYLNVDAYLLIGSERALLIDTLQETEELYDRVLRLTDKPLEVLISHGHPDHAGRGLKQFHEAGIPIRMAEEDIRLYRELFSGEYPAEWFFVLKDGEMFDLGDQVIETILLPGHTPGSAVFFDEKQQRLYSSDAAGSGSFWMQIPGCIPLHEYRDNLAALVKRMDGYPKLRVYPGHRWQSDTQLNLQYLHDTLDLTDLILKGEDHGKDLEMLFQSAPLHFRECSYGMMKGYCYNPENL
jgi:glyoxylase-like metal-dependent hydrolase (beta-lactamase superfamily II)